MVYLWIIVTASFTPYYRRSVFIVLILYSLYFGDLLGEIPFYVGTLLADLSLVLNSESYKNSPTWEVGRQMNIVKNYWPITLAIFALAIGSFPAEHPGRASWSRFLMRVGARLFHPNCTFPIDYIADDVKGNIDGHILSLVLLFLFSPSTFPPLFVAYSLKNTPYSSVQFHSLYISHIQF